MRLPGLALVLLTLCLGLGAAACGGDDDGAADAPAPTAEVEDDGAGEATGTDGGGGGGETTLQLAADPDNALAFEPDSLTAEAGSITIEFTNDAAIPHNVSVEGETSPTVTGDSTSLTVELEAGEYEFICAVPGHAEGGMRGTLAVD